MAKDFKVVTNPAVLIRRLAHQAVVDISSLFHVAPEVLLGPLRGACIA